MGNFFSPRSFFRSLLNALFWLELPFSEKKSKCSFTSLVSAEGLQEMRHFSFTEKKWNKPVPFSRILNGLNENYNFVSLEPKKWKEKKNWVKRRKKFPNFGKVLFDFFFKWTSVCCSPLRKCPKEKLVLNISSGSRCPLDLCYKNPIQTLWYGSASGYSRFIIYSIC